VKTRKVNWTNLLIALALWMWCAFVCFILLPDSWGYGKFLVAFVIGLVITLAALIAISGANDELKNRQ
jgi:FtsH-binding integral membrane protein